MNKDDDEMVEINITLDKETAAKLNRMKRKDLIGAVCALTLRNQVQNETVDKLEQENTKLRESLDKAEIYNNQARSMIIAAMQQWHH